MSSFIELRDKAIRYERVALDGLADEQIKEAEQ